MVKKLILLAVAAVLALAANAYDFKAGQLCYSITGDDEVVVTSQNAPRPVYGDIAYNNLTGNIVIPENVKNGGTTYSVTGIGGLAFFGCSGLTNITIPNSVTYIGLNAFCNCSGLTNITIPNSVTYIDEWVFGGCSGLTSVIIGNSVTSIGSNAFRSCTSLTSVTIPNSVTAIGKWAFGNCSGLTSVTIGNSVTDIGEDAFYGCSGLTSVTIPNSVTSIGDNAFSDCTGLTSVTIGNSVKSIVGNVFNGCSGLTSVTIGNSVTRIDHAAFSGCSGLTSIVVEAGNTTYDSRNNCNAIIKTASNMIILGCKNTTIPNSVTSIGEWAFSGCSGLTSIIIPNSVTSIGEWAFSGCSGLTSIIIPNSVTRIGDRAFSHCSGLTTMTLSGYGRSGWASNYIPFSQIQTLNIGSGITSLGSLGVAPTTVNCYAEVPPTCTASTFTDYSGALHVPSANIAAYLTADYWKNFTNIAFDANDKVTLSQTEAALTQWQTLQLTATTMPADAALTWSSSNPAVATVDGNGLITTAIGVGECYIHVSMDDNAAVYARCHITASYPEITLDLSEQSLALNIGETSTLVATITPDNTGLVPSWSTSDAGVATVDANGVVSAVGEGECDITATVLDQTATCHVTVSGTVTITLSMDNATIQPKEILTVYPTCTPDVMVDFTVVSSDPTVAFARVIDRPASAPAMGAPALASTKAIQIVGIKDGTATVTVGSADGKAEPATCDVTVATVTGIDDIAVEPTSGHQRYNVLGQPVGDDYRGFVIEDGKKVLVQ